jgi:spermidine synthase
MFPAAFFAGMTLPLITICLLRRGAGERALGQVYAVNTAGAIIGVLIAVHLGFTVLGLKGLIVAAAAVDLALGVALLRASQSPAASPRSAMPLAAGVAALGVAIAALLVPLDALLMSSGVYRHGRLLAKDDRLHLYLEGKTTTVSVTGNDKTLSLRTNGKVDGAITIDGGPPVTDEITMTFIGALPLFLAPEARRVANIGFGTGMTTHVLLASPDIERVDTVEIEPKMVEGARAFRRVNWRAFDDPRSRIHYDDAKTYFSAQRQRYDVIVSEPSNPWVSGVASLFSTEFYRDVRRYLRDGGLFMQWIQLYEITPALLSTVVGALEVNFSDYEFWLSDDGNMVIVAAHGGKVPPPDPRAFDNAALRAELARFRIANLDDLALHRLASRAALTPYFAAFGTEVNSDYFPTLEMKAPLARYIGANAMNDLMALVQSPVPLLPLFDARAGTQPDPLSLTPGERPWWQRAAWVHQAQTIREYVRSGNDQLLARLDPRLGADLVLLRAALVDCKVRLPDGSLRRHLGDLARLVSIHLPPGEAVSFWQEFSSARCIAHLSTADRRWLRMHSAVAAGRAPEMAGAAEAILESEAGLQGELAAHAVATLMVAKILMNDRAAALRAHEKYRRQVGTMPRDWEPVFRLLIGHADWR